MCHLVRDLAVCWSVAAGYGFSAACHESARCPVGCGVRINAAEFAREHGVSARTVYRHQARIRDEGEWRERSRRPHSSPRTDADRSLDAWICKLRVELGVGQRGRLHPRRADRGRTPRPARRGGCRPGRRSTGSWPGTTCSNATRRNGRAARGGGSSTPGRATATRSTPPRSGSPTAASVVVFDVLDDCTRTLVGLPRRPAPRPPKRAIAAISKAFDRVRRPGHRAVRQRHRVHQPIDPTRTDLHVRPDPPGPRHPTDQLQPLPPADLRQGRTPPPNPQKMAAHPPRPRNLARTADPPRRLPPLLQHPTTPQRPAATRHPRPGMDTPRPASADRPAYPIQTDATLHRCLVASTGAITVAGHRTSVGTTYAGATITAIRDQTGSPSTTPTANPSATSTSPPTGTTSPSPEQPDQQHLTHLSGLPLDTCLGTAQFCANGNCPRSTEIGAPALPGQGTRTHPAAVRRGRWRRCRSAGSRSARRPGGPGGCSR